MPKQSRTSRKSNQRRASFAEVWADISYGQRRKAELMRPWARTLRDHKTER